jgi:hypothetical protein
MNYGLLGFHVFESFKVSKSGTTSLCSESIRPGALGPLLVDLGLSPGFQKRGLTDSVLDLEHVLGQVEALQVQHLTGDIWSINENLKINSFKNNLQIITIFFSVK